MYRFFQRLSLMVLVFIISSISPVGPISYALTEYSVGIFETLGISLKENIATTYFAGDSILIEGKVTNGQKYARFLLQNTRTREIVIDKMVATDEDEKFKILISLPKIEGKYHFVMVSGNRGFETKLFDVIDIIPRSVPVSNVSLVSSIAPKFQFIGSTPFLSFGPDLWANMYIEQSGKIYNTSGKVLALDNFSLKQGPSKISVIGYGFSGVSPVTNSITQRFTWTDTVYIDRTREKIGEKFVTFQKKGIVATMQFRLKPGVKVYKYFYLTTPDGNVERYEFPSSVVSTDNKYLLPNILIRQRFAIPMDGVYKIETVREDGIAYFNLPISKNIFWSIFEPISRAKRLAISLNNSAVNTDVLNAINDIRKSKNLSLLAIDKDLMNLADLKTEYLTKHDDVIHITKDGLNILGFAKFNKINVSGRIGENIAKGQGSHIDLQDGLEESGSHRHAMVDPVYKKIGIGYARKNGITYLVQVFGE